MQSVEISWSGKDDMRSAIYPRATELIWQLCNEYKGVVSASVHIQSNVFQAKLPVFREARLFLAIFELEFAIIIDIDYVNIREMIFMYDHEKVPHTMLPRQITAIVNGL